MKKKEGEELKLCSFLRRCYVRVFSFSFSSELVEVIDFLNSPSMSEVESRIGIRLGSVHRRFGSGHRAGKEVVGDGHRRLGVDRKGSLARIEIEGKED
jgi:hypothetical protein